MITQWTSHLDTDEDKQKFRQIILSSKTALDRLKEIIEEREKAISSIEIGVDIYTKPGWDALLAHYNGERAALKGIKTLIDLDRQKDTNDRTITA